MNPDTLLSHILGVGPYTAKKLERLNIYTIKDLVYHFPFRYDDYSKQSQIREAQIGQSITLKGQLWSIKNSYTRYGKVLTQALFNDGTGSVELFWFNQPWLIKSISSGDNLQISGRLDKKGSKLTIIMPKWEKIVDNHKPLSMNPDPIGVNHEPLHTGRLVPIYPETFDLTSKWIRSKIAFFLPKVLDQIKDPLPPEIKKEMLDLKIALNNIHFPPDLGQAQKARERLSFDELFEIQLATLKVRSDWGKKTKSHSLKIDSGKIDKFISMLPFDLTSAQKKVIQQIFADLKASHPMNRLVQGEVGSGKTIVAAIAIYVNFLNGLGSLLMAPTEILAFQHYDTLSKLLAPHGVSVGIYTGSRKFAKSQGDKNSRLQTLVPSPYVIVGTHALLSEKLIKQNIGLVVIDEQQRFGVSQRSILRAHAKQTQILPHFLTMTATPIPRTVALTFYGDLDLSIIDELPKGRQKIKTFVVPSKKRQDAYKFIEKKVLQGDQVYIITPLIEPSETLISAKAAKAEFERLKTAVFPDLRLGLLHGKLKPKEKQEAINLFKSGQTQILVSTSVVEVGVDISNATIMVIEGGERFGLSQLHQLRGRVGRGAKQSFCLIFTGEENPQTVKRLKNLEKIESGLKLSEIDLKIRGGGEVFGTAQSGRWNLKIANLSDLGLIEKTREAAKKILGIDPTLDKYPLLQAKLQNLSGIMPD